MSRSSKKRKRSCTAGDGGLGLGTSEPPNGAPSSGVTFQENDFIWYVLLCRVCHHYHIFNTTVQCALIL